MSSSIPVTLRRSPGCSIQSLWFIFVGWWLGALAVAAAYFMFVFIITIPFGIASFRMAGYALWPFGRSVVDKPGAGVGSGLGNVIWFVIAGIWLAIGHVTTAVAQAITIIGIPLAIANLKMIPVTCFPFGKEIVDNRLLSPTVHPRYTI